VICCNRERGRFSARFANHYQWPRYQRGDRRDGHRPDATVAAAGRGAGLGGGMRPRGRRTRARRSVPWPLHPASSSDIPGTYPCAPHSTQRNRGMKLNYSGGCDGLPQRAGEHAVARGPRRSGPMPTRRRQVAAHTTLGVGGVRRGRRRPGRMGEGPRSAAGGSSAAPAGGATCGRPSPPARPAHGPAYFNRANSLGATCDGVQGVGDGGALSPPPSKGPTPAL
jgi:hypothetical protein